MIDALQPMGGYSFEYPDGSELHVFGELNVPPSLERIRRVLRAVQAAGADPEAVYAHAVDFYRVANEERRRLHPERDWPAPSYESVRPEAT